MADIVGWLDEYALGTWLIIRVFLVAAILTLIFGVIGATARLAGGLPSRLASAYVTFFRGTPELLILLLFYFGSAVTFTAIGRMIDPSTRFVDIPPFWAGSLAIALIGRCGAGRRTRSRDESRSDRLSREPRVAGERARVT